MRQPLRSEECLAVPWAAARTPNWGSHVRTEAPQFRETTPQLETPNSRSQKLPISRTPCEISIARGGPHPPQQPLRFKLQFGSPKTPERAPI